MKNVLLTCAVLMTLGGPALAQTAPVTTIIEAQRGTMVTLTGVVERILDYDEFRLTDATGTVEVYFGPNRMPAEVGEQVTIYGFVDDDPGPKEIYARSLTRADGTVITFENRDD